MGRVFAISPGDLSSIPARVIPNTLKMVLDTYLLNTQQYKVRVKDKMAQSTERSCVLPPLHLEKGAFGSPSTTVANFTYFYIFIANLNLIILIRYDLHTKLYFSHS